MMQQADRCQLFHPQKSEKDAEPFQGGKEFLPTMLCLRRLDCAYIGKATDKNVVDF